MTFAEPSVTVPTEGHILIGLDHYYDIVGPEMFRCPNGLVVKQSKVGYFITRNLQSETTNSHTSMLLVSKPNSNYNIERFWRIEEFGVHDKPNTDADEEAVKHFNSTVKFIDNRYEVQWPFKTEVPDA